MSKAHLFTYAGVPVDQVQARLEKPFNHQNAYKAVPGGAQLTDITTGFMLERVLEVFGLKGMGWNLLFAGVNMEIEYLDGDWVQARLRYAEFIYTLFDQNGEKVDVVAVPASGASKNKTLAYAEEGARTSAVGAALKGMGFQALVYKGIMDHKNWRQFAEGAATTFPTSAPSKAAPQKTAPKKVPPKKGAAPTPVSAPVAANGDLGSYEIKFGKHKGKSLRSAPVDYLQWVAEKMQPFGDDALEMQTKVCDYLATLDAVAA